MGNTYTGDRDFVSFATECRIHIQYCFICTLLPVFFAYMYMLIVQVVLDLRPGYG